MSNVFSETLQYPWIPSSASYRNCTLPFSASPHRWDILLNELREKRLPIVKRLYDTRWSAHSTATSTLKKATRTFEHVLSPFRTTRMKKQQRNKKQLVFKRRWTSWKTASCGSSGKLYLSNSTRRPRSCKVSIWILMKLSLSWNL